MDIRRSKTFAQCVGVTAIVMFSITATHSFAQSSHGPRQTAAAEKSHTEYVRGVRQSSRLRERVLVRAQLLLQDPARAKREYAQIRHLERADMPARKGNRPVIRRLAASLANHILRLQARGKSVDINDYHAVKVGDKVAVYGPGATVAPTQKGELTIVESSDVSGENGSAIASSLSVASSNTRSLLRRQTFNPDAPIETTFSYDSCGNHYVEGSYGAKDFCYSRSRFADKYSSTRDFWVYSGTTYAIPDDLWWLWPDPFVKVARSGSQMSEASKTRLTYLNFRTHWPRIEQKGGNCTSFTPDPLQIGQLGKLQLPAFQFCDSIKPRHKKKSSMKRADFKTGILGENGEDKEVMHTAVRRTQKRVRTNDVANVIGNYWARFCATWNQRCRKT